MDTVSILWQALVLVVGLLVTCIGWFLQRTLTKIDQNLTKLFENQSVLSERLSKLEGEHALLKMKYTGEVYEQA